MNWKEIQGWFDFDKLYANMVNWAREGAHFIEVGAWMGKSAAFMGLAIKNSKKKIRFDAVDTWEGSPGEQVHADKIDSLERQGTTLYDRFLDNMKGCGVHEFVNPVRLTSVDAAKKYQDKTLDFVFIDAGHTFDDVCSDIDAWLPKVRSGGVLAGHDYKHVPVKEAVHHKLMPVEKYPKNSWLHRVP